MRAPARTMPQPVILTAGPFRGVRDTERPTASDPTLASYALNMCRIHGPRDAGLQGRPGFAQMGTAQGSGGTRVTQAGVTWTLPTGVRQTVAVVNGQLLAYDWTGESWAVVVTTANLATASITLSASARVALVPFADGLVVSDGVNVPFWWTGAAGAGGLTEMTNCPALYGPPTVYYSKLMGIKASDRRVLVWSEEGEPNVGYEAGGYNNAWDNPGGYADPMVSVAGTNDALYVFRARVSLGITGAVGPDFATAGTRANLSELVGTLSPFGTIVTPGGVVIVDADAQPWLARLGAGVTGFWTDCHETVRQTPRAGLTVVQSVIDEATRSLVIFYPEPDQSLPTFGAVFALDDDLQFCGVWSWAEDLDRVFPVIDGDGIARIAHAGSNDGCIYAHGEPINGPWNDALATETRYIAHAVAGGHLGYDLDRELTISHIEAALTGGDTSAVALSYETPRGQSTPLSVALTASTAGGTWDVDDWDTMDWAEAGSTDGVAHMGAAGRGRWVKPRIAHSEDGERFGVSAFRVRTFATQGNPRVP